MLDKIDVKYFKLAVGQEALGKETDLDISARCPICGDSRKNKNKKRLHLYTKGNTDTSFVNCFNGDCVCKNKTIYTFLRDFYPNLYEMYKKEKFTNNIYSLTNDVFKEIKQEITKKLTFHNLSNYFIDIKNSPEGLAYLKNRDIDYINDNIEERFGKWYFGKYDLKIGEKIYRLTNSIIIPLYYKLQEEYMYGFYSRNIKTKMFFTYNPEKNIGFKIWNWFNINKEERVYIFESIFDAISSGFDNVIALMGAKIPEERLKELKEPVFVLDNDLTGLKNSLEYVNKGYQVYIQPNEFTEKDMNELKIKHPSVKIKNIISENIFSGISAAVRIKSKL